MAVNADEMAEIEQVIAAPGANAQVFVELRRRFPHLSWTRCDAADVIEEPYRRFPHFDIHLLNSADHCAQITSDPASATGIILARRSAVS